MNVVGADRRTRARMIGRGDRTKVVAHTRRAIRTTVAANGHVTVSAAATTTRVIVVSKRSARKAGLIYCTDAAPGIRRHGKPGRFRYVNARGAPVKDPRVLLRIRRLAIPPAWTSVWINPNPRGHLQACGRDARGRKQYRYHADWSGVRDSTKFEQLVAFARALPMLRHAVAASTRRPQLDRERVTAVVVRLLERSLIRVGNEEYARTNHSFGLTTLRDRHAIVSSGRIRFVFPGKSGVGHEVVLDDPALARIVRKTRDLPGQTLFQFFDESGRRRKLRSNDVNAYIRAHTGGDFTAKHFRTWAGTVLMTLELCRMPPPRTQRIARSVVAEAVKKVAARLGNTPAIARKSYIHPKIVEQFSRGELPRWNPPGTWPAGRAHIRLSREERFVLRQLKQKNGAR